MKAPGDMQRARKRHLARQAMQDAAKRLTALTKEGRFDELVPIRALFAEDGKYHDYKVRPWDGGFNGGELVLMLLERKIQVARVVDKDGLWVSGSLGSLRYHLTKAKVFGVVVT